MNNTNNRKFLSIKHKINEISASINFELDDIGLLTGKTGIALFYYYYSKFSGQDKYENVVWKIYQEIINKLNRGYNYHTFCSGICGFAWTTEHLIQNFFFNRNEVNFLNDIDDFLYKRLLIDIDNNNYDFLHGSLGIALYFISRQKFNRKIIGYLSYILDFLEKTAIKQKNGTLSWKIKLNSDTGVRGYNLGLAHGIPSIIIILSKLSKYKVFQNRAKLLLNDSINFLFYHKLIHSHSIFPSWVAESEKPSSSRLAWCYGDLGISVALWYASQATGNKDWENEAIRILEHSAKRRNLQKNKVIEGTICHGTVGIAHIFNRMFINTGIEEFNESATYWFNQTLKMAKFKDGLAGYKQWRTEKYGGWQNDTSLLEGISGIGLAMISAISDIEPAWDECLLLS